MQDDKVILPKRKVSNENVSLRAKGLRSRGTHRASPFKESKTRYTLPFLTEFIAKGVPLNNPLS